jgi:hypothetical protein
MTKYSKFIAGLCGLAATAIESGFHTEPWVPIVTTALSAIAVYLVPNTPAKPMAVKP